MPALPAELLFLFLGQNQYKAAETSQKKTLLFKDRNDNINPIDKQQIYLHDFKGGIEK
ncbi:MAG: hypothetical protein ACYCYE_12835 [Clostridia bacterium]